jgi:hypothetical protein
MTPSPTMRLIHMEKPKPSTPPPWAVCIACRGKRREGGEACAMCAGTGRMPGDGEEA